MIRSNIQLFSSSSCGKGVFSGSGIFSGAGSLYWRQRSAISSEVRFKLSPEAKHGKSQISTSYTLCYTNKGNSETGSTSLPSSYSSLTNKFYSLTFFGKLTYCLAAQNSTPLKSAWPILFQNHRPTYLQNEYQPSFVNTKFYILCIFRHFRYFSLIGLLGWMNLEIQLCKTPLPKTKWLCHGVNFVM